MYPRFIYPVEKFQSIVLRTRHLQRVSDFCNEYYISLILWFFFALEFISINLNSSFFFFQIIPTESDRVEEIPIHLPNATYRSISRVKFVSLPPQLKMHRKYILWTNDARGQRETISSAPEIPASLPHYGSIVGYNRRFFLNEQYRPKIYRRRSLTSESARNLFATIWYKFSKEESKKKRKKKKK